MVTFTKHLIASLLKLRSGEIYIQMLVGLESFHLALRHQVLLDGNKLDFVPSWGILVRLPLKMIVYNIFRRIIHLSNKIRI